MVQDVFCPVCPASRHCRLQGDVALRLPCMDSVCAVAPFSRSNVRSQILQENFKRWNDALVAKDYEKVASLYCSKELSFLPTVSPKFIQDPKETKDYFVDFVKKLPSGTITSQNVQPYGSDAYLHSGAEPHLTHALSRLCMACALRFTASTALNLFCRCPLPCFLFTHLHLHHLPLLFLNLTLVTFDSLPQACTPS
jgi:hypothetical protein